jgi:CARDB
MLNITPSMNTFGPNTKSSYVVTICLAAIGFVVLVGAGMWLAVYSTRFVPEMVNGAGEAAVYLGSLFIPNHKSGISVVPATTASTTISFGTDSTSTPATSTSHKHIVTTAGTETDGVYQISGTAAPVLSGRPDLIVNIDATGYLATSSAGSFIAASTIPEGVRPAVSFTIKNIGTNASGAWRFSVSVPTQIPYTYQSQPQQSLNPGDSIDYVIGFDQSNTGTNEAVSIIANFDNAITESNTNNNSASAEMTIL